MVNIFLKPVKTWARQAVTKASTLKLQGLISWRLWRDIPMEWINVFRRGERNRVWIAILLALCMFSFLSICLDCPDFLGPCIKSILLSFSAWKALLFSSRVCFVFPYRARIEISSKSLQYCFTFTNLMSWKEWSQKKRRWWMPFLNVRLLTILSFHVFRWLLYGKSIWSPTES